MPPLTPLTPLLASPTANWLHCHVLMSSCYLVLAPPLATPLHASTSVTSHWNYPYVLTSPPHSPHSPHPWHVPPPPPPLPPLRPPHPLASHIPISILRCCSARVSFLATLASILVAPPRGDPRAPFPKKLRRQGSIYVRGASAPGAQTHARTHTLAKMHTLSSIPVHGTLRRELTGGDVHVLSSCAGRWRHSHLTHLSTHVCL